VASKSMLSWPTKARKPAKAASHRLTFISSKGSDFSGPFLYAGF
jgi:hypothetical protein